jgi:hypothetical protein
VSSASLRPREFTGARHLKKHAKPSASALPESKEYALVVPRLARPDNDAGHVPLEGRKLQRDLVAHVVHEPDAAAAREEDLLRDEQRAGLLLLPLSLLLCLRLGLCAAEAAWNERRDELAEMEGAPALELAVRALWKREREQVAVNLRCAA